MEGRRKEKTARYYGSRKHLRERKSSKNKWKLLKINKKEMQIEETVVEM